MTHYDTLRDIVERIEQTTEPKPDMVAVPLDVLRGVLAYVKALEAEHAEAIELLKRFVWDKQDMWCPVCDNWVIDGHAADCKLAKLIKEREG
jgi:hypothetical protein